MKKFPSRLVIAAMMCLAAPTYAQNTKGTGAETKTTTTTNPTGTSIIAIPRTSHDRQQPSPTDKGEPIDKGNPTATRESQSLGNPKNGLMGSSK
jgi:hypothetical protein